TALSQFGQGKTTDEVLRQMTGVNLAELDRLFRADLASQLQVYRNGFFVRPQEYADLDDLKERSQKEPGNLRLQVLYGWALAKNGAGELAESILRPLTELASPPLELWLAKADLALLQKNRAAAKQALETLIARGGDGFDARIRLGLIALKDQPES